MSEKERAKINQKIHIAGIAVLVAVMIYMIYAGVVLKHLGKGYAIAIGVGIFLFWLLENVVRPMLTKELDDMTPQQVSTFKKCALLNLGGYAGLVYFALSLNTGTGIYGAIVYVVCLMMRRRLQEDQRAQDEEAGEAASEVVVDVPENGEEVSEIAQIAEVSPAVEDAADTVSAAAEDAAATDAQDIVSAAAEDAEEIVSAAAEIVADEDENGSGEA